MKNISSFQLRYVIENWISLGFELFVEQSKQIVDIALGF